MREAYWCETCNKYMPTNTCLDCGQPTARLTTDYNEWDGWVGQLRRLQLVAKFEAADDAPLLALTGEYCDQ